MKQLKKVKAISFIFIFRVKIRDSAQAIAAQIAVGVALQGSCAFLALFVYICLFFVWPDARFSQ